MAMFDNFLVFTEKSAALTADGQIGKVVDLGQSGNQMGGIVYNNYFLEILVKTAAASAGAGRFTLQTSDALIAGTPPTLSAGVIVWESDNYSYATLVAGKRIRQPFPGFGGTVKRYLALNWDETTDGLTALQVSAKITLMPGTNETFPDAQN